MNDCKHENVFNRDDIEEYFIPIQGTDYLVFVCPDCNGFVTKEEWEEKD